MDTSNLRTLTQSLTPWTAQIEMQVLGAVAGLLPEQRLFIRPA